MIYKVISTKKGFLKQSWCFVSCLDSRAGTWINFPPQLAAPMPLFLLRYAEIGPLNLSSLWFFASSLYGKTRTMAKILV